MAGVLLVCYWLTLAPTITEPDSGELATAVHVMGVPHPTGYPLYLMVGKLFDLLPLGEPAHRVAFFSAASAAAAGGVVCWAVLLLTGSAGAGVLAGVVLGLSPGVWKQATQAEVYALSFLLASLIVAMYVRWMTDPSSRRLNQLACVCGLALTHHRASLFFIAPTLLWALFATRPRSAGTVARALGWLVAPLVLYLWLPFRSSQHPLLDWGDTSASLSNFLVHISGSQYARLAFHATAADAASAIWSFFSISWKGLGTVTVGLVIVGLTALLRSGSRRALGISLSLTLAAVILWAAFYAVPDKDVFFAPGLVVLSLWAGMGADAVVRSLAALKLGGVTRLLPAAAMATALAIGLSMGVNNWTANDRSQDYSHLDNAVAGLAGVPSDAVLLMGGDEPFGGALYYYYALKHGRSPDILSPGFLTYRWYWPFMEHGILDAVKDGADQAPVSTKQAKKSWLAYVIREHLDPARPLYTSMALPEALPGWARLQDYLLNRLVMPPGIPQARDRSGRPPLLEFPGGALLEVVLTPRVRRGEPYAITADIRWSAASPPAGDLWLMFVFLRSDVPPQVAIDPQGPYGDSMIIRPAPLLFNAALPPNRPGWHYQQVVNDIFSHRMRPGTYRASVQLLQRTRSGPKRGAVIPVGEVDLL